MSETILTRRLHRVAIEMGAAGSGVGSADPYPEVAEAMADRDRSGARASLGFTYKDPVASASPVAAFPWARSIFTVAVSYLPEAGAARARPGYGRVARFATADHYLKLRRVLERAAGVLDGEGHRTEVLADDDRLVDRAAAVRAGVGWWGSSTMVLVPGVGPWALLGSVVTDARLDPSDPMIRTCGSCRACLPACPTGALTGPGELDARLCLARILQGRGAIPRAMRPLVADRIYGCDDCLDACPPGDRLAARSTEPNGEVDLLWLLGAPDETLLARFSHFYLPGRRPRYLRRNALVAVGNWGAPAAIPMLAAYVGGRDPFLRLHAAWAIGRIDDPRAPALLDAAMRGETVVAVSEEIRLALGAGRHR